MDAFFNEQAEESLVKSRIVTKYFDAWARVMLPRAARIGYVELFCGQGRYEDGAESTPLLVMRKAIAHPKLPSVLLTCFVDADAQKTSRLQQEFRALDGLAALSHPPTVITAEITDELVAKVYQGMGSPPSLLFADPCGYRGLSRNVIQTVVANWGCDAIFFFNYNRINAGLNNEFVRPHMVAIFGERRAHELDAILRPLSPAQREEAITQALKQAMRDLGVKHVLLFRFRKAEVDRTSHYLVFVTKHALGEKIMKEIMAAESSDAPEGVASLQFQRPAAQASLPLDLDHPLKDLAVDLLRCFAGQTLTVADICRTHSGETTFRMTNYQTALKQLEADGQVSCTPAKESRPANTMAEHVRVTFPKR